MCKGPTNKHSQLHVGQCDVLSFAVMSMISVTAGMVNHHLKEAHRALITHVNSLPGCDALCCGRHLLYGCTCSPKPHHLVDAAHRLHGMHQHIRPHHVLATHVQLLHDARPFRSSKLAACHPARAAVCTLHPALRAARLTPNVQIISYTLVTMQETHNAVRQHHQPSPCSAATSGTSIASTSGRSSSSIQSYHIPSMQTQQQFGCLRYMSSSAAPAPRHDVSIALSGIDGGHIARMLQLAGSLVELDRLLYAWRSRLRPVHVAVACARLEALYRCGTMQRGQPKI